MTFPPRNSEVKYLSTLGMHRHVPGRMASAFLHQALAFWFGGGALVFSLACVWTIAQDRLWPPAARTATTLNRLLGRRTVMFADLIGTFAMVAVPVLTTNLWAVAVAAFLGGLGGTLWTVNSGTISQHLVPGGMMGRYNVAARLFSCSTTS